MGRGLALRWALMHEIWLGSRRIEKAERISREYESVARGFYGNQMKGSIRGVVNSDIPPLVEVVVLTLPPRYAIETVPASHVAGLPVQPLGTPAEPRYALW